jgi:hypothetical protein
MGDRDFDAEQSIRNRAYAIWEEDGRPDGKHLEHWQKAQSEVAHRASLIPRVRPHPRVARQDQRLFRARSRVRPRPKGVRRSQRLFPACLDFQTRIGGVRLP